MLAKDLLALQRGDVVHKGMQGFHRASARRKQAASRAVEQQNGVDFIAAADVRRRT